MHFTEEEEFSDEEPPIRQPYETRSKRRRAVKEPNVSAPPPKKRKFSDRNSLPNQFGSFGFGGYSVGKGRAPPSNKPGRNPRSKKQLVQDPAPKPDPKQRSRKAPLPKPGPRERASKNPPPKPQANPSQKEKRGDSDQLVPPEFRLSQVRPPRSNSSSAMLSGVPANLRPLHAPNILPPVAKRDCRDAPDDVVKQMASMDIWRREKVMGLMNYYKSDPAYHCMLPFPVEIQDPYAHDIGRRWAYNEESCLMSQKSSSKFVDNCFQKWKTVIDEKLDDASNGKVMTNAITTNYRRFFHEEMLKEFRLHWPSKTVDGKKHIADMTSDAWKSRKRKFYTWYNRGMHDCDEAKNLDKLSHKQTVKKICGDFQSEIGNKYKVFRSNDYADLIETSTFRRHWGKEEINDFQLIALLKTYRERTYVLVKRQFKRFKVEFNLSDFKNKHGYAINYFTYYQDIALQSSKSTKWDGCQTFNVICTRKWNKRIDLKKRRDRASDKLDESLGAVDDEYESTDEEDSN